jgi:hypothetical protein
MNMNTNACRRLCLVALLVCLGGCGDDDPVVPPAPPPGPATPDELMSNFLTIYESMDAAELIALMDPGFVTILQQATTADFPELGATLDVQEETRIHERMFSKQDVTDPNGVLVPGIKSIEFQTIARQGAWTVSRPDDPIPDTECAIYDVVVLFGRGPGYSTLKVQGALKFYVARHESVVGGVTHVYYRMAGQVDLTADKFGRAEESTAWGRIKAIFR